MWRWAVTSGRDRTTNKVFFLDGLSIADCPEESSLWGSSSNGCVATRSFFLSPWMGDCVPRRFHHSLASQPAPYPPPRPQWPFTPSCSPSHPSGLPPSEPGIPLNNVDSKSEREKALTMIRMLLYSRRVGWCVEERESKSCPHNRVRCRADALLKAIIRPMLLLCCSMTI